MLEGILEGFGDILHDRLDQLAQAGEGADTAQVRRIIHELTGCSVNLGMRQVASLLGEMHDRIHAQNELPGLVETEALLRAALQTLQIYREAGYVSPDFVW